jgi:glutamyl-tRNA reductase
MRLGVLGLNHKTADLTLREAIAKGVQGRHQLSFPTVLLSTCNRMEIYFSAPDLAEAHSELLAWLRQEVKGAFEHKLYSYFGADGFVHLCRVTAGLDSAIFAESEIQRQVKMAYAFASWQGLPKCLHFSFQKALKIGKMVRTQLAANRGPSLYETLWRMAEWRGKKILLVGWSDVNRRLASFLLYKGIQSFVVASRHPERVTMGKAESRAVLERWHEFDIVVCAAPSAEYLIQGEGKEGCVLFDLSVPRNIDPEVGKRACLYNIEEIHQRVEAGLQSPDLDALVRENAMRLLELRMTREAGEGDHIADVLHAGYK